MRLTITLLATLMGAFLAFTRPASAQARDVYADIALKSGESTDIVPLAWTIQCKSYLKGLPEIEILDGPPGVTAAISETMYLPRTSGCAKKFPAGMLSIKAGEIAEDSSTDMKLRIRYNTLDGRRVRLMTLHVVLIAQ
jgi:hypothetical protein